MGNMFSTVTSKGQVTIPRHLRDRLGIVPGEQVIFSLGEDEIRIARSVSIVERTAGALEPLPGVRAPETAEEMRRMAEEAIAEDALRRMGG
ncbi:MAG: AbrB/MazE/SpoVT family DNA-binding domain-containing protein [Chloroflexota bacterium]|nr:AbrB/MazE/SpoVT family DNA-binding domain-containing protein [Chloroflexota bacterium]